MKLFYHQNVTKKILPIKNLLLEEILQSRVSQRGYNFEVNTVYTEYLYNILLKFSREVLNPFTLTESTLKVWCYYADKQFQMGDVWHNHMNTSTINAVLYLETVKGCGLQYSTEYDGVKIGNIQDKNFNSRSIKYFEPKNYDLVLFPNFLNHRPIFSKNKRRISLNLELSCLESSYSIFDN